MPSPVCILDGLRGCPASRTATMDQSGIPPTWSDGRDVARTEGTAGAKHSASAAVKSEVAGGIRCNFDQRHLPLRLSGTCRELSTGHCDPAVLHVDCRMRLTNVFRQLVSCLFCAHKYESSPETKGTGDSKQPHNSARSSSKESSKSKPSTTLTSPNNINNANSITNTIASSRTTMPGATSKKSSKYDAIPGPLGLASASLEGKVALVTGAGM